MEKNLIGRNLPTACGDAVIDVRPDEPVLILIKHCRDMKQQEARLRLITLLLLLGCAALFCFTIIFEQRQQRNSEAGGQRSAAEQSAAYARQDRLCTADEDQNKSQKLRIDHSFVWETNMTDKFYIKWAPILGEEQEEKHAIVIPETGYYYIYVRFLLRCQDGDDDDKEEKFNRFFIELHKWNEGYNKDIKLTEAWDGVMCPPHGHRTVFVGQLFDLLEGDHVKVWIEDGYNLISRSSFGAFRE